MKMAYGLNDMMQAAIGAFSAVIFFYVIKTGDELVNINPMSGLIIGFIWLFLLYNPFKKHKNEHITHFIGNLIISIIVTSVLAVVFKIGTYEQMMTFEYFGSAAWIGTWLAMPIAMLFDMKNLNWVIDRYYTNNMSKGGKRR